MRVLLMKAHEMGTLLSPDVRWETSSRDGMCGARVCVQQVCDMAFSSHTHFLSADSGREAWSRQRAPERDRHTARLMCQGGHSMAQIAEKGVVRRRALAGSRWGPPSVSGLTRGCLRATGGQAEPAAAGSPHWWNRAHTAPCMLLFIWKVGQSVGVALTVEALLCVLETLGSLLQPHIYRAHL